MIVFPFKFPLWDRFVYTKSTSGLQAALAEFPTPMTPARLKRCVHFDEQLSLWIIEVICAYRVPIIPGSIFNKNTLNGVRWKRDTLDPDPLDQRPSSGDQPRASPGSDWFEMRPKAKRRDRLEYAKQQLTAEDKVVHLPQNKTMIQLTPATVVVNAACYLLDLVFYDDLEAQLTPDDNYVSRKIIQWSRPVVTWSLQRLCRYRLVNASKLESKFSSMKPLKDTSSMMSAFCYCVHRRHRVDIAS
ncbi:hypothetical protein HDE_06912 [Halotydeus destructor]|nr:hypothetical protein HDE_06912 [Halotydeus destructor]